MHHQHQSRAHVPVMLEQVLAYLTPEAGDRYLDLTAGYGGHAAAIIARTGQPERAVLVDRDANAVAALSELFQGQRVQILRQDFLQASKALAEGGQVFDVILADLGVSSPHLNDADRGFSLQQSGPLDMRMDQTQARTAADIVNRASEAELADVLVRYGEEPKARLIARLIAEHRPFTTTDELAAVVRRAWPGHSKVHPATRTFQALRLAVNDELRQLEQSLPIWIEQLLAPGGRLAVISFHSLEDRLVKAAFKDASEGYDARLQLLTKHPAVASATEIVSNPRARSAKLRAAVKNKKQKERNVTYANRSS